MLRASTPHPDWRSIEHADFSVFDTPPPAGVRNLRRIDGVPGVVAIVVALLAFAALGHAVSTVAKTNTRQLAVLRAIGFVRRDVAATLATSALAIVGIGLVLGVPLGLVAERLIWHALERQIGFESRAVAGFPVAARDRRRARGRGRDRRAPRLGCRSTTPEWTRCGPSDARVVQRARSYVAMITPVVVGTLLASWKFAGMVPSANMR